MLRAVLSCPFYVVTPLYDQKPASLRPVQPEPSIPDLTTSLPRGMSDHEIEQADRAASISFARNAGNCPEEIELYFG